MYSVEVHAPRLVLVTLAPPVDVDVAKAATVEIRAAIVGHAPTPSLLCTDVRSASAWPPAVGDVFLQMMRADNPMLAFNGIVYTPGGSMGLQLARLIREAGRPDRRYASGDPADVLARYEPHATHEEIALVRSFLDRATVAR